MRVLLAHGGAPGLEAQSEMQGTHSEGADDILEIVLLLQCATAGGRAVRAHSASLLYGGGSRRQYAPARIGILLFIQQTVRKPAIR